jgi:membrane-associated PAP2 superfamily phosphatase
MHIFFMSNFFFLRFATVGAAGNHIRTKVLFLSMGHCKWIDRDRFHGGLLYTDLVGAEHGAAHPGRCWARPTIPDRLFYFAVGCGG